jgi:hypothetical protein
MSAVQRARAPWPVGFGAAVLALLSLPTASRADPWIPAAGDGSIEPAIRDYDATSVFPTDRYGATTLPASDERYTMLRITGTHGIGHRLAIEYDLRAGRIEKIRSKHGRRIVESATGVEDRSASVGPRSSRTCSSGSRTGAGGRRSKPAPACSSTGRRRRCASTSTRVTVCRGTSTSAQRCSTFAP